MITRTTERNTTTRPGILFSFWYFPEETEQWNSPELLGLETAKKIRCLIPQYYHHLQQEGRGTARWMVQRS